MKNMHYFEFGLCRVLEEISKRPSVSMPDLAGQLGVKASGLEAPVRALRRKQLVVPGRTRGEIALNREFGYLVGIDMGASHLHLALADFSGEVIDSFAVKVRPEDGPRKMISQIKKSIRKLVPSGKQARLRALALGVPSPVDPRTGLVLLANNLPGWTNIDLKAELQKAFRVPVSLENDANMAALGEHWRGVAQSTDNFIFIALGTGIGSGVFANGRLYVGRGGAAGELHSMNVEWPRWQENFGGTGYFESHASGQGIARLGRKLMKASARNTRGSLAKERDAYFVFEAFHRGDPAARGVLERIFTILGVGIANIVAVMDPDMIVLGGGISRGAPDFMLTTVSRVGKKLQPDCPPIRLSALGDKAQTYGAIFSAMMAACQVATCRASGHSNQG
jgi:glucokinase